MVVIICIGNSLVPYLNFLHMDCTKTQFLLFFVMQNVDCTKIALVNIVFVLLFMNCYHPRVGADIFACIIYLFTFKPLFYRFESSTSMLMKSNEPDLFLILRQGKLSLISWKCLD